MLASSVVWGRRCAHWLMTCDHRWSVLATSDVDLAGDPLAQGAVLPVDGDHEGPVEGVLLDDLDLDAGHEARACRGR